MRLPKKCLVDTNVPKTANLATQPDPNSDVPDCCVLACIEAVEHVIKKRGLVIDAGDEIFDEYRQQLSMKGQPGVGDRFIKWVHDNRWSLPALTFQRLMNLLDDDAFPDMDSLSSWSSFPIPWNPMRLVAADQPLLQGGKLSSGLACPRRANTVWFAL